MENADSWGIWMRGMEVLWALLATFLKDEMLETAITRRRGMTHTHEPGVELETGSQLRKGWRCNRGRAGVTEERHCQGASDLLSDRLGERAPKKQT